MKIIMKKILEAIKNTKFYNFYNSHKKFLVSAIILPILLAIVNVITSGFFNDFKSLKLLTSQIISIQYLDCNPYTDNSVANYDDSVYDSEWGDFYLYGCVLNLNFQNPKNRNSMITKCNININDVGLNFDDKEVQIISNIIDGKIKISAVNNSFSDIKNCKITLIGEWSDNGEYVNLQPFLSYPYESLHSIIDINSGDVKEIFSIDIDSRLEQIFENNTLLKMTSYVEFNNKSANMPSGYIQYLNGKISLNNGGLGAGSNEPYLVLLDTDNLIKGKSIEVPLNYKISGRTSQNMQIVIGCTKSCTIQFSVDFFDDSNKHLMTDIFETNIKVPVYQYDHTSNALLLSNFMRQYGYSNLKYDYDALKPFSILYDPKEHFSNLEDW